MSSILLLVPISPDSVAMPGKWSRVRPPRPWWRSAATRPAMSGSSVSTAPASPSAPRVLLGKKDSTPPRPCSPAWTPSRLIPMPSALSSSTTSPCRAATSPIAVMSAMPVNRCAGSTNRLAGVTAASIASGASVWSPGSMSANCGTPPASTTAEAVATKEKAGTITPSPAFSPAARSKRTSASVPLFTPTTYWAPVYSRSRCSN